MKVILTPRERKRTQTLRHLLAVAPNTATKSINQSSIVVGELIEIQTNRLSKLGDDNPKRQPLADSIETLVKIHGVLKTCETGIRDNLGEASRIIQEALSQ